MQFCLKFCGQRKNVLSDFKRRQDSDERSSNPPRQQKRFEMELERSINNENKESSYNECEKGMRSTIPLCFIYNYKITIKTLMHFNPSQISVWKFWCQKSEK